MRAYLTRIQEFMLPAIGNARLRIEVWWWVVVFTAAQLPSMALLAVHIEPSDRV